jgi:hypothetical protein
MAWPPEGFVEGEPPKQPRLSLVPSPPPPVPGVDGLPPMKPKTGQDAYDPNSKTQKKLARRTAAGLQLGMKKRRDEYVKGLLMGFSRTEAAVYAGVPRRSAPRVGSELFWEPYVQEQFKLLREAIEEEELCSKKELLLNVKGLSFDPRNRALARVAASNLLAEMLGYKKATKIEGKFVGGVMVVHQTGGIDDWEKAAMAQQEQLRLDVSK